MIHTQHLVVGDRQNVGFIFYMLFSIIISENYFQNCCFILVILKVFAFLFLARKDLTFYVERNRDHLLPLYLETRRDQLDPKTLDFEYVELVLVKKFMAIYLYVLLSFLFLVPQTIYNCGVILSYL